MIPIYRNNQKELNESLGKNSTSSAKSLSSKFTTLPPEMKAIFNSMEELSIGMSQNLFKRSKVTLKRERIFGDHNLLDHYFKSSVLLNTDDFFEKMLEDMVKKSFYSRDELLAYLEKKITDIGNQFIFLSKSDEVIREKMQGLDATSLEFKNFDNLIKTIAKSINRLLDFGADKITAAMNVSNKVYEFLDIEKTSNPNKMLAFYFKSVMGYENILSILKYIDENFAPESIFRAIDFLLESTATDLKNPLISTNPDRLHSINTDIAKLRVLKTTFKRFKQTIQYIRDLKHREDDEDYEAHEDDNE